LSIRQRFFGETDPTVATTLCGLAELALAQAHYPVAEPLFRRALTIREAQWGAEHPSVATVLEKLAVLLRQTGRETEATDLDARAQRIRAKQGQTGAGGPG